MLHSQRTMSRYGLFGHELGFDCKQCGDFLSLVNAETGRNAEIKNGDVITCGNCGNSVKVKFEEISNAEGLQQ